MRRIAMLTVVVAVIGAACSGGGANDDVLSVEDLEQPVSPDAEALGVGGSEPDEPPAGTGTGDQEEAMLAFTQCMREQGIDIADPEVGSDGELRLGRPNAATIDREAVRAARDECSDLLEGVTLGFRDVDQTALQDALVEYAACMRENGYDMPDPDLSGFGAGPPGENGAGRGIFGGTLDQDDPAFQAADEVCRPIFTDAGFGEGRGPGLGRGPGGGNG
jgi:hypothetical protein